MIWPLLLVAAVTNGAQQTTPQPGSAVLSSQSAFTQAFVKGDWLAFKNGLSEDAKASVLNPKGHQEQTVVGRDQAVNLVSSIRPSLGEIAVTSCEFSQMKFGPSVICLYSSTDKNLRSLMTIATLRGDRVAEFGVAFSKKFAKAAPKPERGD